jgi:hypothetical protein
MSNVPRPRYKYAFVSLSGDSIKTTDWISVKSIFSNEVVINHTEMDSVSVIMMRQTLSSNSIALSTSSSIVNAAWEMIYRLFSNSISAPSPSTTKALRRLSRQVSKIETALDRHVMHPMSTYE